MKVPSPVIIITGAAQGIGFFLANHYATKGAKVVAVDQHKDALDHLQEISAKNQLLKVVADVSDEEAVSFLIQKTLKHYGRIDCLINNAAIARNQPLEELQAEDWRKVIDVNLTGPFLCAKYAVPHLRKTKGSIINIASTRAFMSEPHTEAYSASKGGIVALTHSLAISLGPDIRVNSISPGWIDVSHLQHPITNNPIPRNWPESEHKQHPSGRIGTPEDIASTVDYLLDIKTTFVTGQNFIVDGGMTRKMIYE